LSELLPAEPVVFPRPPHIPAEVSNAEVVQVARSFLYGEKYEVCALALKVGIQEFHSLIRGGQWRELLNHLRDEFLATTGNRLVRLEQKILEQIEGYIDDGVEGVYFTKEGGAEHYTRKLSPREAAVIARTHMETNKRLDRLREGDPTRKTFDFQGRLKALERAANAKTVEGEAERAA
jgi:hypothetical protein